jgi:SAM-dependent methyltransferase
MTNDHEPQNDVHDLVRRGYAAIATGTQAGGGGCCGPASCGPDLAQRIGYGAEDVAALPEGADMGLSCGNPTALASLREGEVVLDLGSGGGMDAFVAGPKVGARGRVVGVDMTPEMVARARRNLAVYRQRTGLDNVDGLDNVEFRLGEIEHLPVADASIDVVISNCVLNLSPDKPQVWREIARVLRRGGRVAVSDLALLRPLPDEVARRADALVGCVAGAVLLEDMRRAIAAAGLVDARLTPKPEYVAALRDVQDPLYRDLTAHLPAGTSLADFVTSVDVAARKA